MGYLDKEMSALDQFLPGLREKLEGNTLATIEAPDGVAIGTFREVRGPGLLISTELGGRGANAVQAVRVQRALGALAPSLAVASVMHHFTVATLLQHSSFNAEETQAVLQAVGEGNVLIASGFAEGMTGANVMENQMLAEWDGAVYRINGAKKPCSLSRSMDILSAGVRIVRPGEPARRGFAVVLAADPGITRKPFWNAPFLTGAESDEVILQDVVVPAESIIPLDGDPNTMHPMEVGGLTWLTVLLASSYTGIASALIQRLLASSKGSESERVQVLAELEACASAVESHAHSLDHEDMSMDMLWRAQLLRYAVQDAIKRASAHAVELLGGFASIRSNEIGYLFASAQAQAFHPPSRSCSLHAINMHFSGR
jgi:alkylation response protein AidB-like acyl-CoA dehydrogenase